MFSLKLLGGAVIEGPTGPLGGRVSQRRRLALLAVLALSRERPVSRDRLLALFWPESDPERARHSLADSLYQIRKDIGEGAILSVGEELRLNPEVVRSDVGELDDALARGALAAAAATYAGPFLDGFYLSDAPEFERWAESERDRLARAYAKTLEQLADEAAARADTKTAVEWWRRLATAEPYNARVTLRLMQLLEASGDRAGAIQCARLHSALLEQEFEATPDPQVTALAERMRAGPMTAPVRAATERPQRPDVRVVAASVEEGAVDAAAGKGRAAAGSPHSDPPARRSPARRGSVARRIGAVGGLAILAAAAVLSVRRFAPHSSPRGDAAAEVVAAARGTSTRAIAVLPFENLTGAEEDAAFTEGMHSDLITALSRVGGLTVISRASVLPYRDHAKALPQIGRELGVDVLLEGGMQRMRSRVRVNAQLSDAHTGQLLWAESYTRELTVADIFAIQSEITERIVASLEASLTAAERERITTPPTEDLTAYQLYQKARETFDATRTLNLESERLLRRALEADPKFAPAWAELAQIYGWRPLVLGFPPSAWDTAFVFVRRALEADPNSADAYTAMAVAYGHQGHLQREESAARKALELNPNDAFAFRRLAESYRDRGAFVEALRYHKASVRLSPNHVGYRSYVGLVYSDLGDQATAERWLRGVLVLKPNAVPALMQLAEMYLHAGPRDSAVKYADRQAALYPNETLPLATAAMVGYYLRDLERARRYAGRLVDITHGAPARATSSALATTMLGFAELQAGDRARADSLFDQSLAFLNRMVAAGATAPRWPYEIGLIHAARGDTEGAITWLETAYTQGFRWTWMLERDPMLDSVRQDPRFQGLVARVRADVAEMRRRVEQEDRGAR